MSTRIHKVLGYALTDLNVNDGVIIDKRLTDKYQSEEFTENFKISRQDLLNFCEKRGYIGDQYSSVNFDLKAFSTKKELNQLYNVYDFIKYDNEFGIETVFLITLPWFKEWSRYDDIIDYCENSTENKIHNIWGGIYPYIGGEWINLKTKEIFKHNEFDPCLIHKYLYEECKLDLSEYTLKKYGTIDKKVLKNILNPVPPTIIKILLEYMNIFKDINSYYELKPIVYTYWS